MSLAWRKRIVLASALQCQRYGSCAHDDLSHPARPIPAPDHPPFSCCEHRTSCGQPGSRLPAWQPRQPEGPAASRPAKAEPPLLQSWNSDSPITIPGSQPGAIQKNGTRHLQPGPASRRGCSKRRRKTSPSWKFGSALLACYERSEHGGSSLF